MAKNKMNTETIGQWSFILGVAIAVLVGIFGGAGWVSVVLIILGVIVGVLNISDKEVYDFLIAAIALLVTGAAGLDRIPTLYLGAMAFPLGNWLGAIFLNISTFVAPAAIIVALKAVYELGKDK
jgi:hypothetical protein